jgi:soluble lytic murein transglycosylase-like protein
VLSAGAILLARWVAASPEEAMRLVETPRHSPIPVRGLPFAAKINRVAARHGLDPSLVASVVFAESGFDPQAASPRGARGLMQVRPTTWPEVAPEWCRPTRCLFEPGPQVRRMLDRFGDLRRALAAYNAGPAAVERSGGMPPYPETERYLRRVALAWWSLRRTGGTLPPFLWGAVRSPEEWERALWATVAGCAVVGIWIARRIT